MPKGILLNINKISPIMFSSKNITKLENKQKHESLNSITRNDNLTPSMRKDNQSLSIRNDSSVTKRIIRDSSTQNQSVSKSIRGESSSKSIVKKIIRHSPMHGYDTPTKNNFSRDNSGSSRILKTTITRRPSIPTVKDNVRSAVGSLVKHQKENSTYNLVSRSEIKNPMSNSNLTPTGLTSKNSLSRLRTEIKKPYNFRTDISPIKPTTKDYSPIKSSSNIYSEVVKRVENNCNKFEYSKIDEKNKNHYSSIKSTESMCNTNSRSVRSTITNRMHPRETINRSTSRQNEYKLVQNNSELLESVKKDHNSVQNNGMSRRSESYITSEKKGLDSGNRRELSRDYRQSLNQKAPENFSIDYSKVDISSRSRNSTTNNNLNGSYKKLTGSNYNI